MASLNVPVSGRVARVAADLEPELFTFERVRERHSLVAKRLDMDPARVESEVRPVFRDIRPFELSVTGIDYFETPTRGRGPVVYFAVESPGLERLHGTLVDAFGAIEGLEGDDYVPHVTLARGGAIEDAERLAGPIDPVTWTASRLDVWSGEYREVVSRIGLR